MKRDIRKGRMKNCKVNLTEEMTVSWIKEKKMKTYDKPAVVHMSESQCIA